MTPTAPCGIVLLSASTRQAERTEKGQKKMTRKDYELLAKVFNRNTTDLSESQFIKFARLAEDLATELQAENPRFDTLRFLKACGLD